MKAQTVEPDRTVILTEVQMGWDEILDKLRKDISSEYVSCDDPDERQYLRQVIKEELPELSGPRIDSAINYCCSATRAPRMRREFLACLRKQLGG